MMMRPFPDKITYGQKYDPAMKITDPTEADTYFERCVEHQMRVGKVGRAVAQSTERANLGYWAGYSSHETRSRVERLFRCAHPVFGAIAQVGAPTQEEALQAGLDLAARGHGRS